MLASYGAWLDNLVTTNDSIAEVAVVTLAENFKI